jgi:hypothetical protein
MNQIPIQRLKECLAYCPVTGVLTWLPRCSDDPKRQKYWAAWNNRMAGKPAGAKHIDGYLTICLDGVQILAHRAAIAISTGELPEQEVDHINGVRADNRLENLRCVDKAENLRNQKVYSTNKSGCAGVYWCKTNERWVSKITKDKRTKALGMFRVLSDAITVRKAAEAELGFHKNHGRAV